MQCRPAPSSRQFDAQMAQERAARLADAWKARQQSPPEPPKPQTRIPTADMMDAFIAGQRSMGKGKGHAAPFPQAWGTKGKGKGKAKRADPFVGLDGRSYSRGRDASRDRDGFKRGRHAVYERHDSERDGPRPAKPCYECGTFYYCKSVAAAELGEDVEHGYCSNRECSQSLASRLAQKPNVPFIIEETQPADAEGVPMPPADAAVAPAAGAGHSDTDVSVPSPASPVGHFVSTLRSGGEADAAFQRSGWSIPAPNQQLAVAAHRARNRSDVPAQLLVELGTTSSKAPPAKAPPLIQAAIDQGRAASLPLAPQGPMPGTPEIGAASHAAGAAGQMADRKALPKGTPVVDFAYCDSPTLAAPADAASPSYAAGAAPAVKAHTPAPPGSLFTAEERLEVMTVELNIRRAEVQTDWDILSEAAARAERNQAEMRRLEAENAGWRRQQVEGQAAQAAREARMAELAHIFAH